MNFNGAPGNIQGILTGMLIYFADESMPSNTSIIKKLHDNQIRLNYSSTNDDSLLFWLLYHNFVSNIHVENIFWRQRIIV